MFSKKLLVIIMGKLKILEKSMKDLKIQIKKIMAVSLYLYPI